MSGKQIAAAIIVLFLGYTALDSAFIVNERQRVVVVQLGEIVGHDYEAGLHFKLPFIQDVRYFNDRVMTFTAEIKRVLTSENKNLTVDYYVKWQISETVDYLLSTHGDRTRARSLLNEIVENDLLAAFSKRTMTQAIDDDRNEIVAAIQVKANQDARELGMQITDVRIMRLNLPEEVRTAVYKRMRSEREVVIRALKAQGEALAQEIRSDAERQRAAVLAQARARAQAIKGEADARAAAIYARAYQKNSTFYNFYRSLQLYREAIGKDDLLVLQPDGALFRFFNPESIDGSAGQTANEATDGTGQPLMGGITNGVAGESAADQTANEPAADATGN